MQHRKPLPAQTRLFLQAREENGYVYREFTITDLISDQSGRFCMCYSARHSLSACGVLKEFCPKDFAWQRLEDGSLKLADKTQREAFERAKEDYQSACRRLIEARRVNEQLASFIPYFELYDPLQGDAFYIFSYEPRCLSFEEMCAGLSQKSVLDGLWMLFSCMLSLLQALCVLHQADLYHCDIKPDNFGYLMRNGEILSQKITLFDTNSIIDGLSGAPKYYSPGYTNPNARHTDGMNQYDIYAAGRCLLYGLEALFEIDHKPASITGSVQIGQLLSHLKKEDVSQELIRLLRKILMQSIGYPRYEACEVFEEDLRACRQSLLKPKTLPAKTSLSDSAQLQKLFWTHFYRHPLIEKRAERADEFCVLIAGNGPLAAGVLDHVLILGQMTPFLHVSVIGMEGVKDYLAKRPALGEFFTIQDQTVEESCGQIEFHALNAALGIGRTASMLERFAENCPSSLLRVYLCFDEERKNTALRRMLARSIGRDRVFTESMLRLESELDTGAMEEIERIGLNVHLSWDCGRNPILCDQIKAYQQPYYRIASILMGLSLPTKITEAQVEYTGLNRWQIAQAFCDRMQSMTPSKKYAYLCEQTYIEHRRWMAQKVVDGFVPKSIESSVAGSHIDFERREHVCLVRSSRNEKQNHPLDLDALLEEGIFVDESVLDELDQVSVDLSSRRQALSQSLSEIGLIDLDALKAAGRLLNAAPASRDALARYLSCAKEVAQGSRQALRYYTKLKDMVLAGLESADPVIRTIVSTQISTFDERFAPVLLAAKKMDFKKLDTTLVESIPFLLTWSQKCVLYIPAKPHHFRSAFFAAVTLRPKMLFLVMDHGDALESLSDLRMLAGFLDLEQSQTDIRILLFDSSADFDQSVLEELQTFVQKQERFASISRVDLHGLEESLCLQASFADYLGIEQNDTEICRVIKSIAEKNKLDATAYTFDLDARRFHEEGSRKLLEYCRVPDLEESRLQAWLDTDA